MWEDMGIRRTLVCLHAVGFALLTFSSKILSADYIEPGNIARGKPTEQSSTRDWESSNLAVDGNDNTGWEERSCTHTISQQNPWWQVDLQKACTVAKIKITNRGDCCHERLSNFEIRVGNIYNSPTSNTLCSHSQGSAMGRGETRDFYCSPPITGRYVYIVINGQGILTLCEVGVYSSSVPQHFCHRHIAEGQFDFYASSHQDNDHSASNAYFSKTNNWCSSPSESKVIGSSSNVWSWRPYLHLTFNDFHTVQGFSVRSNNEGKFYLAYQTANAGPLILYKKDGTTQIFEYKYPLNKQTHKGTAIYYKLQQPLHGIGMRFVPLEIGGINCFRVVPVGCKSVNFHAGIHHDLGIRNHLLKDDQMNTSFATAKKEHARLNSPYPGWAPLPYEITTLLTCQLGSSFDPNSWPLYFDIDFGCKKKIMLFVLEKSRLSWTIEITKLFLSYRINILNEFQLYSDDPFLDTRLFSVSDSKNITSVSFDLTPFRAQQLRISPCRWRADGVPSFQFTVEGTDYMQPDHLWLFDKLTIASWSPVATITDERGTINLETNVLQKTGSNDKDYRIDNFELSNGVEWIKSKDSLHGDCLTSPKHCKDGMSLSFWLSNIRKGSKRIVLNILDLKKDLSQFNVDTGSCMERSVQVGFESLDTNKERLSGIRFRYSPVPRLSKIYYASLKLKLAEDGKGHSNAQIKVFAIVTGNANYVATCLHNDTKLLGNFITFRLRKTPKANEIIWTPDISSIIQQRVNEVNYAPGNALVIVLAAVKGDNNEMFHFNFLNDVAPPVLELKYSSPRCKTCKAFGLSDPQQIKDDQFSATGHINSWSGRTADKGRLFGVDTWCAYKTDPTWLEVDFISTSTVIAIGIQGDPTWINYVTSFKLKYRTKDLVSDWMWVFDDTYAVEKVFAANEDESSPSYIILPYMIFARRLRFDILKYVGDIVCARFEVYGCELSEVVSNSQDIPIVSAGLSGTEANPEGEGVALYHDGSALKAMVVSENRKWIAGSIVPLKECSWTHISVTWSKTNGLKFYKNRKLIDCQKSGINITDSLALAGQSFLLFGTFYNYSLTYGLFRISRLGIWKYELGPDDTTEIYGSGTMDFTFLSGESLGEWKPTTSCGGGKDFRTCPYVSGSSLQVNITHDTTSRIRVSGYESYQRNISYQWKMSEIISFVDESINCKQYLRTECHGSVLNWGVTDPVAWVVVRSSMQLSYLPGGPPDGTGCSCGITNSCENSAKKCNCDANILKWLLDDGYIVDKAALPITRLAYGDTEHNKEELYHTLGEVECTVKGNPSWQVKHTAAFASSEYKSDTKSCASSSFQLQFSGKGHLQSSVAIEFRSLDIPTNSTIQDARITFYSSQTSLDDNVTMEISITSPEGLSSNFISSCLHKDIGTQALVKPVIWHLGQWMSGSRYTSPNVSHLIQYLVSYSSWSHENTIVLVIRQYTDSAVGSARHAYSHKSDTSRPKLSLYYTSQNPERHIYPDGLQGIQQPWLKFTTRYHVSIYSCLEFNFEIRNQTAGFFSIVLEQDNYLDTVFQLRGLKNTGQLIKASLPLNVTKRSSGQNKFRLHFIVHGDLNLLPLVYIDNIKFSTNSCSVVPTESVQRLKYDLLDSQVLKELKLHKPIMIIPLDSHKRDLSGLSVEAKFIARESKVFFDYYGFPMSVGYFSGSASSLLHFKNGNVLFSIKEAFTMMVSLKPMGMSATGNVMIQFIDNADKVVLQMSYYQSKVNLRVLTSNSEYFNVETNGKIALDTWSYVAFTYDAKSKEWRIYRNSEESQVKLMTEAMGKLEIKEVVLGGDLTQSNPHFSGYLECFQLYDTKLLPSTIKGLRFCPNRHTTGTCISPCQGTCDQLTAKCLCKTALEEYRAPDCQNALLASVYKNSSLYLPFDSKEISLRVSDDFSEALNSSDSANGLFTPGPINEAYCTSYTGSTKLFDIKSNCFQNFESCSDGFSLTFWMKSASLDKLTPNVTYSLMTIDVFYMSYKFDIKNVNKLTLIVVKRNTTSKCNYFTVVPANIWFHLGFVLNGNHINVYINGRYGTVLKKECHANEVYVRDQVATVGGIGHSLCIDDLSVWMTPLSSDKVYRSFSQEISWVCTGSDSALGISENLRKIPDSAMTSSSDYSGFVAYFGRLHTHVQRTIGINYGSWAARISDVYQYLQIDLSEDHIIYGVATQGRSDFGQWVKTYQLEYSEDGSETWKYYQVDGTVKTFQGNVDQNSVVKHNLETYLMARKVRFRPQTWHGHVSMRVEIYGCLGYVAKDVSVPEIRKQYTVTIFPIKWKDSFLNQNSPEMSYLVDEMKNTVSKMLEGATTNEKCKHYRRTEVVLIRKSDVPNVIHIDVDIVFSYFDNNHRDKLPSCKNKRFVQLSIGKYTAFISEDKGNLCFGSGSALGISEPLRKISNSAMTASSVHGGSGDLLHAPFNGRLYHTPISGVSIGGWAASTLDMNQYLQIDLSIDHVVTGVATQGRDDTQFTQWVKTYQLQYSKDGSVTWEYYKEDTAVKTFQGNVDGYSVVKHDLISPIVARRVRFRPQTWNIYISMRVEIYGCQGTFFSSVGVGDFYKKVQDWQMTASSWQSNNTRPEFGRLYGSSVWSSKELSIGQYFEINLGALHLVAGVASQGTLNKWVTSYKIKYSSALNSAMQFYQEGGVDKIFQGNTDQDTIVRNNFLMPLNAQVIQFWPQSWQVHISMRVEVYGAAQTCTSITVTGVGQNLKLIPDSQITASSNFSSCLSTARLFASESWCAETHSLQDYVQIDLGRQRNVVAVATQGRPGYDQWVKTYKIKYSAAPNISTQYYEQDGIEKVFQGNSDRSTVVYNYFDAHLTAQVVQFWPLSFYAHPSMRVEIFEAIDSYPSRNCHCSSSLGVSRTDKRIRDSHITASSHHSDSYYSSVPSNGRLYGGTSWSSQTQDGIGEYLQIDLGGVHWVTGVATQGRGNTDQWVTAYKLKYSVNISSLQMYQENGTDKIFQGNYDRHTVVRHDLVVPFKAQIVQFLVQSFKTYAGMRVEVYGGPSSCIIQSPPEVEVVSSASTNVTVKVNLIGSKHYERSFIGFRVISSGASRNGNKYESITDYHMPGGSTFTIHNLRPFSIYNFEIFTKTQRGESPSFKISSIVTDESVPSACPRILSVTTINQTALTVDFEDIPVPYWNGNPQGYCISYKPVYQLDLSPVRQNNFSEYATIDVDKRKTQFTVSGLQMFTNYSFLLGGRTAKGIGKLCETFGRTAEGVPEELPKNIHLSATKDNISASWDPLPNDLDVWNSNKSQYKYILNETFPFPNLSPYSEILKLGNVSHVTIPSLRATQWYEFKVAAITDTGDGNFSESLCIRTKEAAPSAAPNLTVTNITGDTIDISIGNIAEDMENGIVQYYQVRLTITEAGKQKEVFHNITGKHSGKHTNSNYSNFAHPCSVVKPHEKTSQERSFKLENLKYYTEYSLAGKACTDAGCGPFSASKTVKTDEYIPFCSPHGISIIVLSSTQLRVTWNRPPTGCSNGLIIKYKISTYYRHWDGNGLYLTFENFTQAETITLTQLKKYSGYCFNITAFTSKGHGPYSGIHCEKTLQDKPDGPPASVNITSLSSTSILITMSPPLPDLSNGKTCGYYVCYGISSSFSLNTSEEIHVFANTTIFNSTTFVDSTTKIIISNLRKYAVYEVYVAAFTVFGHGPKGNYSHRTLQDVPDHPPLDSHVLGCNATSITLSWGNIPADRVHGIFVNYVVTLVETYVDGQLGRNITEFTNNTFLTNITVAQSSANRIISLGSSADTNSSSFGSYITTVERHAHTFVNLTPFTNYTFRIGGCTEAGCGVTVILKKTTSESAPIGSPMSLHGHWTSSMSLHISWQPIPICERYGLIVGYNIFWNKSNEVNGNFSHRFTEDLFIDVSQLVPYEFYRVTVAGRTFVGPGPNVSIVVRTDQDKPTGPPSNVMAAATSGSSLKVMFKSIPFGQRRGIIIGYMIFYQTIDKFGIEPSLEYDVPDPSGIIRETHLFGLELQTNYSIEVAGYTSKGIGPSSKMIVVSTGAFVHGNWSIWSSWGLCSTSCGGGIQLKRRTCTNPPPWNGGHNCTGNDTRSQPCNTQYCSGPMIAEPGVDCNKTCQSIGYICLEAIQTHNSPDIFREFGKSCNNDTSLSVKSEQYHPSFSHGRCEGYIMSSPKILCDVPDFNKDNEHKDIQRLCSCVAAEDFGYTEWAQWGECSKTCNGGIRKRKRICNETVIGCPGKSEHSGECNTKPCPVDGSWGRWSNWMPCNVSCGNGFEKRVRLCDNPKPSYGGKPCPRANEGANEDLKPDCNPDPCPVDGGWTNWTSWEPVCTNPCGGGIIRRKRYCENPPPSPDGRDCIGDKIEVKECNIHKCSGKEMNCVARFTNETWHFTLASDFHGKKATILKEQIKQNVVSTCSCNITEVVVHSFSPGSVIANFTIYYEEVKGQEVLELQEFIAETSLLGAMPVGSFAIVSPEAILRPPVNVSVSSINYKSVMISWSPITFPQPVISNATNSNDTVKNISALYVYYQESGKPVNQWQVIGIPPTMVSYNITDLKAYTDYEFYMVTGVTDGTGAASVKARFKTIEGAPSRAPGGFTLRSTEADAVYLEWIPIPLEYQNGRLVGYGIRYKKYYETTFEEIIVSAAVNEKTITGLKPFSLYWFELLGYTRAGGGPITVKTVKTLEGVPAVPPPNVRLQNYLSTTTLHLRWDGINSGQVNGILMGYIITYESYKKAAKEVGVARITVTKTVDKFTHDLLITNLESFATYKITVTGYTQRGSGPISEPIYGDTCHCEKKVFCNWHEAKPYVFKESDTRLAGLFPNFIQDIVVKACGSCTGYMNSTLSYFSSKDGSEPNKESELRLKSSISDGEADISFPVFGRTEESVIFPETVFIPIVQSPGSAMITRDQAKTQNKAVELIKSVVSTWPMFAITLMLAIITGYLIWFTDQFSNPGEFAVGDSMRGPMAGFWWAFVSMTTVGYGDQSPKSYGARMVAVGWTLVGLVLNSILLGSIATSLTTLSLQKEVKLYGSKVSAVKDSFEYNLAIRRNSKVNPVRQYTTHLEVLDAVASGEVDAALLDTFIATSLQDIILEKKLRLAKLFKANSGFGIVLSGYMVKLKSSINGLIASNQPVISEFMTKMQGKVPTTKYDPLANTNIFDKDSEDFHTLWRNCLYAIGGLSVIGIIWSFINQQRKRSKVQPVKYDGNYLADVTEEMIKNFPEKIKILLEKLYRKHRDEFLELNSVKKSFRRRYKKSLNSIPVQVRPPKQNPKTIPALKKLDTRTSLGFSGTVSLVLQEKRKMEDVSI